MKKKLFIYPIFCLLSLGLLTTSCSSDDDSQSIVEGNKKIKITLTVNNVAENDYVNLTIGGTKVNQTTVLKLNGVPQNNVSVISFSNDDFMNGTVTYVIEDIDGLYVANTSGIINDLTPDNAQMTYSYVAEVNDNVVQNVNNAPVQGTNGITLNFNY
nr:hypothetical protein [uncultured Flavobacterium sp.]